MARKRRSQRHRWSDAPGILIHGIQSIGELWSKLDWEVEQFERARYSTPPNPFAMSFIAVNASITIDSLEEWFWKNMVQESRRGDFEGIVRLQADGSAWTQEAAQAIARSRIAHEAVFRNIANTAKHGAYRSEGLEDLRAAMTADFRDKDLQDRLEALDEGDGADFILTHWDKAEWRLTYYAGVGDHVEFDALELFSTARDQWAEMLREFELLD